MQLQANQDISAGSRFSTSSRASRATAITVLGAVVVADVDLLAVRECYQILRRVRWRLVVSLCARAVSFGLSCGGLERS